MELEKIEHSENAIFQRYYFESKYAFTRGLYRHQYFLKKDEIIIKENFNIAMIYSNSGSNPNQYEKKQHIPQRVCAVWCR